MKIKTESLKCSYHDISFLLKNNHKEPFQLGVFHQFERSLIDLVLKKITSPRNVEGPSINYAVSRGSKIANFTW